ncbi:hypothetical protein MJ576_21690 [Klebsiella pneumoniae]|nr:hypothetical protein MJ576_21690 [Klebsiella pneumoniae]
MTTTVQNYLDKGLRGLWYPVLASWEVQSAPVTPVPYGTGGWLKQAAGPATAVKAHHTGRYGPGSTKTGFIFEKKGQSGVNFDWVELGNSGAYWMRLSIPYKKRFGPGGHFWIVGMVVPEDNDNCRVFFWRIRGVQGWQRDLWRFMYRNRLEKLHWEVLEQDRVVLESLAPNARDHEYLYQHDVGLSRLRRMMQKAAKEQLALREAQQGAA